MTTLCPHLESWGASAIPGLLYFLEPGQEDEAPDILINYSFGAALVLAQLGELSAVPFLLDLLTRTRHAFRRAVIAALGQLRDVRAVPPLIAQLQDRDASVRGAAAVSLGVIGDPRALPALQEMYQSDSGRDAQKRPLKEIAAEAIARIQDSNDKRAE